MEENLADGSNSEERTNHRMAHLLKKSLLPGDAVAVRFDQLRLHPRNTSVTENFP